MSQLTDEERRADAQAKADAKALVKIAQNLRAIEDMYDRLGDELAYAGVDADAMTYAGPVANLEAWEHRYEAAEARGLLSDQAWDDYASDQDAEWHPVSVLAFWVDIVRDERGQPTDLKATVKREADYLRKSAPWFFQANEHTGINFPPVDALMNDLQRVKTVLENVLHAGEREDHGVPCMKCGENLTRIRYRHLKNVRPEARIDKPDTWKCKPCGETSTMDQYNLAVRQDYLRSADRLTATDMLEAYRIKPGTLIVWASRDKVHKRGKDDSGRQLYDVEDALKMRDKTSNEDEAA